jgi:Kdo2-lipid IVA lauroyltransferase/acyltransferase
MNRIFYQVLYASFGLFAKIPFAIVYFISDLVYFLVYHAIGYRKKVVLQNLQNSFPEKSELEIKKIAKKFYIHFADTLLETIKIAGMNMEDFQKRVTVKNTELLNQLYDEGKSVVIFCAHYGNWEWVLFICKMLKHTVLPIYQPLNNPYSDAYFCNLRAKFGGVPTPMQETLRALLTYKKQQQPTALWLAADQTPAPESAYWTSFLHQDTPFYTGGEKIAKKFQQPAVFMYIKKTGRGRYEMSFELMEKNPENLLEGALTQQYVDRLEETIKNEPAYWLWSHRRWKHQKIKI